MSKKMLACALAIVCALLLMGNVDLQQVGNATPVDIGQTITTVGQYGLLAWLIVRAEARQAEQQKAWREERRWMVELMMQE